VVIMSQTLRWGILGTGNIARQFCADVRASRRGRLAAVGSRAAETARQFAAAHGIPAAMDSYAQLVARDDIDAVYVSLPNSMHHQWTLAALRAGKHVLCEKPLAPTVAEVEEMFDVARQTGRLLVEAFMYRSHPQTHAVIEAVRKGMIGELRQIRTSFCYRTANVENNIRFNADLKGGALMDIGCYCVNFSRLFAGEEPARISAYGRFHSSGVDEIVSGVLQFPGGVLATFTCGMSLQADNMASLCGSEGYIEIPVPWKPPVENATWRLAYSAPPRMDRAVGLPAGVIPPPRTCTVSASGGLYALEADDFAASVLDGAPPRITREDSVGTMRTLVALRAAIEPNHPGIV
jgi:D-xylose 1-dehydrogenase (NADP+, D-xylono-1,5-lactone-forming)